MPFISEKRKKMGGQESEARASSKERIGGTSNQEIPCPTGANNLDSVWREWSRQCHVLPHIFFIWTGTGRLGWVGRLPVSHQPCPCVHCRPHGAHCLQRSGHSAQRTGSLKLWRGRTLCASPWRALNCSCTFKESVAVAGEQRAMHARCNP